VKRMHRRKLHLVVRTPHSIVVEEDVLSLRVPTESGQVGIRPRGEPSVTPIEPGLAIARGEDHLLFLATAGGILRSEASVAVLLTPVAFVGSDPAEVLRASAAASAGPDPERELRQAIERLEAGMLRELRAPGGAAATTPWSGGERGRRR
jgi:F0F1-type ATP synthase epsilon subunit